MNIYDDDTEFECVKDSGAPVLPAPVPLALSPGDRPRERLRKLGPEALADKELLAILLNTGIRGKHVLALAADLLDRLEQDPSIPPVEELVRLTGMGISKASAVVAMLEFGRRRWGLSGRRVSGPGDIYRIVRHYADRPQERFICLSMNGAHEVLAVRIVTIGLVNRTIVHPREVFADPLMDRASAIIVAHNHPSGIVDPSAEDDEVTSRLKAAADVLGLRFLDHVIFSDTLYFSYRHSRRLMKLPLSAESGASGNRDEDSKSKEKGL
jgi:DNA repair protein RadC